jgi:hypothetical protein
VRLSVIVHDARRGVKFDVADPDLDLRLRLDRTQFALSRSATR